jgi:hypothetical protein
MQVTLESHVPGRRSTAAWQLASFKSLGALSVTRYDLNSQESIVLFDLSEEPGIAEFIPRPSKYTRQTVV